MVCLSNRRHCYAAEHNTIMQNLKLKAHILIPFTLMLGLLLGVFTYTLQQTKYAYSKDNLAITAKALQETYLGTLDRHKDKLGTALEILSRNTDLREAMVWENRNALLEQAKPLLEQLRKEHNINHISFHTPKRHNYLRVHQPKRSGDKVDRFTLLTAEGTGELSFGAELDASNNFTLHAVLPWRNEQRLIGYIELGESIDPLLQQLSKTFNVDVFVLIDKKFIVKNNPENKNPVTGRAAIHKKHSNVIITNHTGSLGVAAIDELVKQHSSITLAQGIEFEQNGQHYGVTTLALQDAGNQNIGSLLVVRNMSAHVRAFNNSLLTTGAISLAGGIVLFVFFYILLGKTEQRLITSHESMEEANRIREAIYNHHLQDLEFISLHDHLTKMPNRELLLERLTTALDKARTEKKQISLVMLNLHRLKEINDTLGYDYGDRVIQHVAERLHNAFHEKHTMAKISGKEFALLLLDADAGQADKTAQSIQTLLEDTFQFDNISIDIDVSIGIALYPDHADDAKQLMQRADIAMHHALRTKHRTAIYDPGKDPFDVRHLSLLGELREAIKDNALTLHYQPKMDLHSGEVIEVEALVRWNHPQQGMIPPGDFIPIAEQTSLIHPLTYWVFNEALRQCREWMKVGINIRMAVNLSAHSLLDRGLLEEVEKLLKKWDIAPSHLLIEITESTLMADPEHSIELMNELQHMGISLSIDDFGTGYSSLSYLSKLPVEELKIDRSIVQGIIHNERDAAIVYSTIELAHHLGLKVVAEGIESEDVLNKLREHNCDMAQGYFICPPQPPEELKQWFISTSSSVLNTG